MAIWGPLLGSVGGAVIGGIFNNEASDSISDTQREASDQSVALARENRDLSLQLQAPFYGLSVAALEPLARMMGLDYAGGLDYANSVGAGGANGALSVSPGADFGAYVDGHDDLGAAYQEVLGAGGFGVIPRTMDHNGNGRLDPAEFGEWHWNTYGRNEPSRTDPTIPATAAPGVGGASPTDGTQRFTLDDLMQRPGVAIAHQAHFEDGQEALMQAHAAAGLGTSGKAVSDLADYSGDFAAGLYNDEFARLMGLAGFGQTSANAAQSAGNTFTNTAIGATQDTAAADALASANRNNAWASAFGSAAGAAGDWWANRNRGGGHAGQTNWG